MQIRKLGVLLVAAGGLIFLHEQGLLSAGVIWILGGTTAIAVHLHRRLYPGLLVLGCGGLAWGVHLTASPHYAPQLHRPMLFLIFGLAAALAYLAQAMLGSPPRILIWAGLLLLSLAGIEFTHVLYGRPLPASLVGYWPMVLIALGLWLIIDRDDGAADGGRPGT